MAYLRNRDDQTKQDELAAALFEAGYALEALLLAQASAETHGAELTSFHDIGDGVWKGRRAWQGDTPPALSLVRGGDIWLDTCELTASILLVRREEDFLDLPAAWKQRMTPFASWLALRPMARWQFQTFLEMASTQPCPVQVEPPFALLDARRILSPAVTTATGARPPTMPVTAVTPGEAQMCAVFWGKSLPDKEDWELAQEQLSPSEFDALWGTLAGGWSEWVAYSGADEAVHVAISKDTLHCDPEDTEKMQRGEWAYEPMLGMRTVTSMQTGLLLFGVGEMSGPLPGSGENLCLTNQAPR